MITMMMVMKWPRVNRQFQILDQNVKKTKKKRKSKKLFFLSSIWHQIYSCMALDEGHDDAMVYALLLT